MRIKLLRRAFTVSEFLVVIAILGSSRNSYEGVLVQHRLKWMGLGLQNYEDIENSLPPGVKIDAEGRSLHSWRTLLLPYVEEKPLYDQIKLDHRWDEPAQGKAFEKELKAYRSPAVARDNSKDTRGRAQAHYSANRHLMGGAAKRSLANIPDGASNTILAGEAVRRIPIGPRLSPRLIISGRIARENCQSIAKRVWRAMVERGSNDGLCRWERADDGKGNIAITVKGAGDTTRQ